MKTILWAAAAATLFGCMESNAPSADDRDAPDHGVVRVTDTDGSTFDATYAVVDGRMMWQEDIDLGPAPSPARRAGKSFATSNLGKRWTNARVDYVIDSSAAPYATAIRNAAAIYTALTPLVFHEGQESNKPYLKYVIQNGVSHSAIGMTLPDDLTGHVVYLDDGFTDPVLTQTILHETGHAMGLHHEQQRADGNTLDYDSSCVESGEGGNFTTLTTGVEDFGDYDDRSIMEYNSWNLCDNTGTPPVPAPSYATRKKCTCYPLWRHGYAKTDPNGMVIASFTFTAEDINTFWHMYEPSLGVNGSTDQYGGAEVSADFDRDGYPDLAIGAPGNPGGGAVFVYKGTRSGLVAWSVLTPSQIDNGVTGDRFGAALAAGDLDGDGYDDLAIGAPGKNGGAGEVYVWLGGSAGRLRTQRSVIQSWLGGSNDPNDNFGAALAIADLDGDGAKDLAIGDPNETTSGVQSGYVYVVTWKVNLFAYQKIAGVRPYNVLGGSNINGARFGTALAVGDFTHDHKADLAVGAPENSVGPGTVYIFAGGGGGPYGSAFLHAATQTTGDRFGAALAVGDYNGNTWGTNGANRADQLAIGAPRNDASATDAGRVYWFASHFSSGNFDGMVQLGNYGQGVISGGVNAAGDHFGAVLASGDLDSDGNDDLVAGVPDKNSGAGAIAILFGSSSGLTGTGGAIVTSPGGSHAGDAFGSALAIDDFTGNGRTDFTIGGQGDAGSSGAGAMYFFTGRQTTTFPQFWSRYDQESGTFQ